MRQGANSVSTPPANHSDILKVTRSMEFLKYGGLLLLVVLVLTFMLIGILSVTRGGTVKIVMAEGDDEGPCDVRDPHFLRLIELFTERISRRGTKWNSF